MSCCWIILLLFFCRNHSRCCPYASGDCGRTCCAPRYNAAATDCVVSEPSADTACEYVPYLSAVPEDRRTSLPEDYESSFQEACGCETK